MYILHDLELSSDTVPLIIGETPHDSRFAALNDKIAKVPDSIPTSHIVSARGLEGKGDSIHFSNTSYRELGKRYAETMAELLPDSIFKEPIPDPKSHIYRKRNKSKEQMEDRNSSAKLLLVRVRPNRSLRSNKVRKNGR